MNTPTQPQAAPAPHDHTRTGLSREALKRAFTDNLFYVQGRFPEVATPHDLYMAAAYTVRDRLLDQEFSLFARTFRPKQRDECLLAGLGVEQGTGHDLVTQQEHQPMHRAHELGMMVVFAADLLSLALLKSPGELGADIVAGDGQSFGGNQPVPIPCRQRLEQERVFSPGQTVG